MVARQSAADQIAYLTGARATTDTPPGVGEKFDAAGGVLPFAGNTTLCHIPADSAAHAALCAAQTVLRDGLPNDAYAFLPAASLHMTVVEGVNDPHRTAPRWPAHLPADMPLAQVTSGFDTALAPLSLPQSCAIRPVQILGGNSLTVTGASAVHEASLRRARDRMADALNHRRPDHNRYRFHITLAYLLRWLTVDEATAAIALSDHVADRLIAALPSIELGAIAFCRFENMHAFETLRLLQGKTVANA